MLSPYLKTYSWTSGLMPHKTTEQWAALVSSIACLCYFVQGALEDQCSGHTASAIYFALGVITVFLNFAMLYGFVKEKICLLKLYIITTFLMGLGCLFAPVFSDPAAYGSHCYLAKFEPVIMGVLQMLAVGFVWRGLYVMTHPRSTEVNPPAEVPPAPPSEPVKNDDPPSYNDVVLFRSFSSPSENSTAFTVPLPYDSPQGFQFSYGSLNSMPPSYLLAISQAPHDAACAAQHLSLSDWGSSGSSPPNAMSVLNINE